MKMKSIVKTFAVLLVFVFSISVASAASLTEQRQHIRDISRTTLLKLYDLQPAARGYVENAAGYGVFGNWGVKLLFIGGGTGKGMAVNNSNNHETFMDMVAGTVGFGLGAKTYNVVFIFETEQALEDFTNNGWQFGGGYEGNDCNSVDVVSLYHVLGAEVIPTYEDHRDAWVEMMHASIDMAQWEFSAARMLQDYYEKMYV